MIFYLNPFSSVFLPTQFCWGFYLSLHSHVLRGGRGQLCPKKGIHGFHELPLLILDWTTGEYVVYIRLVRWFWVARLLENLFLHHEIRHKEQRLILLLLLVNVGASVGDVCTMTATMSPGWEQSWHARECRKMAGWCCWSADQSTLQSLVVGHGRKAIHQMSTTVINSPCGHFAVCTHLF